MAERERNRRRGLFGFRRAESPPKEVADAKDVEPWDMNFKALASLSKMESATKVRKGKGAPTTVSYSLLRDISLKSEVVAAILRRTVDDVMGNGYRFELRDGVENGDPAALERLEAFFSTPNPEDMGDEWLMSLVYDLTLFGDAYLELDGSRDRSTNDGQDWTYGGNLVSIWNIPADTVELIPHGRLPEPPEPAYQQSIGRETRRFSADKVLHISNYRQGRGYGTSPLIPLLETIAGQLNLSNYMNEMFTGTLPKTILNVGDISNAEMKTMLAMLEQQLSGGKSPFGLVAVNGGSGFQTHRLIDSVKDGQHLDLLYYYREQVCSVFGIPPMKLGWVQTGKLSNPEQQLEAWYDVVESIHHRIATMVNNRLLPLLGVRDYVFRFNSIRPSKEKVMAEVARTQADAIAALRQEGVISINEARSMLGMESLEEAEADDPFFLSPKLSINRGAGSDAPSPSPAEDEPPADEEPTEPPAEEERSIPFDEVGF